MTTPELCLAVGCIATGAVLSIVPFVLEYQALVKVAETNALTNVVAQVQDIGRIAEQISGATARWQNVQDEADKTANAARTIAEKMAAELKLFTEFMQRANDSEKSTLRLEVEKLRRGEQDWLQVLVRMLDHVHALHAGAVRSGQPNLIEQLTHFQNACRDVSRRVGLVPISAEPAEPFDPQRHQVMDGDGTASAGAIISDMVATGYTYQGRMLRPILVRLQQASAPAEASGPTEPRTQLPLPGTQPAEPAS
ncbi:MAG TPA: nucleotide exchange factor GrpE [Verrucomicrobiae bacterium]